MDIRGLTLFISDVRKMRGKNKERERVDKELAKIRKYFNNPKLKGYDRKKCVAKLLYIFMLGYEIEIGHIEAINLLASTKYSEKHMGYLACSILLNEEHEMTRLITERCRIDLTSYNPKFQCLALTCIGNVGGKEQAESLIQEVKRVLIGSDTTGIVRKKSALTLLRLYRKFPELLPPDTWSERLINLLSSRDLGVITSLMSLLLSLSNDHPKEYSSCVSKVVRLLVSLVINKQYLAKYLYYGIPAPWLQIKLLRFLQYYPCPTDSAVLQNLNSVIDSNIEKAERLSGAGDSSKSSNRYNALHAVFFETLNLVIHYDNNERVLIKGTDILLKYINDREPNLRYLSLDTLSRLAYSKYKKVVSVIHGKQHQILMCLKDSDISIRRRALDVLYSMCGKNNADKIVGELLEYLPLSDFGIREELVLKIAILAEKFAVDLTWYVDVILNLIRETGDFVSDDIWYRVCQIITNREDEDLQKYTAETVFQAVSSPAAHEVCVKVAGYILGEFGDLIADDTPPIKQFKMLCNKFEIASSETKSILLNSFVKMYNLYENASELRNKIRSLFQKYRSNFNIEIQQRSNEYNSLIDRKDEDFMDSILDAMPVFTSRLSAVYRKLFEKLKSVTDQKLRMRKALVEDEVEFKKEKEKREAGIEITQPDAEVEEEGESEEEEDESEEEEKEPEVVVEKKPAQPNLLNFMDGGDVLQPPVQKQQTKPVTQTGTGTLLDINSLFGAPTTQPQKQPVQQPVFNQMFQQQPVQRQPIQQQQQQPQPQQSNLLDFLGGSQPVISSGSNLNVFEQKDVAIKKQIEKNYFKLLTTKLGMMVEDDIISVKVKQEYRDNKGRLGVYFKNKSSGKIGISVEVKQIDALKMDFSKGVSSISPGVEEAQYFKMLCMNPFLEKPNIKISIKTSLRSYSHVVPLPVVCFKFIIGYDVDSKEQFFKIWGSISNDKQMQSTFRTQPNGYNAQLLKELIKTGFNLKIYSEISDQTSVIAGGKFVSQNGNHIVLLRVQINPQKQAVRVTSKSTSEIVNKVVHNNLKEQIEEL